MDALDNLHEQNFTTLNHAEGIPQRQPHSPVRDYAVDLYSLCLSL